MEHVTKHNPTDYLPAAGRDALLPFYDILTTMLGAPRVHRTLIYQAGLAAGQRVLEIGCGTGNLTLRAKRTHPDVDVIGSDPDPLALARARRKARDLTGIQFERGYAQRLPYPDASFDRVLSALMLHHLDHDTKVAAAKEVSRVLRPGGSLHLVDFTGQAHGMHGFLMGRMQKAGHTADDIPALLDESGLDCVEMPGQRLPVMGRVTYYRATRRE